MKYDVVRDIPPPPPPPAVREVILHLSPRELKVLSACVDASTGDSLQHYGVKQSEAIALVGPLHDVLRAADVSRG